ncbi:MULTISPECIES: DUF4097 family beta strand repeat-containing protein [unclassified Treponema]|uniref:DUF4097 family beta strand repeat-containing protein n=1 Tax=unclassified Treponema TaxID=2638727 RepID=UPI0020A36FBE|nr:MULTISPECIES: DUF4097 family beta strand repeat-containing protein [unclassified Treponema]UTC67626.1 DUF4097 family beta strand repeat protein [Treponema sp. OMZ 789]UTC70354.1 DUF4097 family beta strand repeat protein [Treponema sp. OMZ 790]UTC73068.1 DUF4097 family beta strand repeat protein [Treponema sp. OMZ 791]
MNKIGKTVLIIFLGLMLVGIGYILGGRLFYKSKHRIRERNFIDRAYNKIMSAAGNIEDMADDIEDAAENIESLGDDMNEYFGDEYEKAETISLNGIKNFYLKSEVAEVRIEIIDKEDEAYYKIYRINPKYFDVEKKGDTISFEDNTPSKFFKTIGFNFKKHSAKIYIGLPRNMVFNNFEIKSGVGELDIHNINIEKFTLSAGVGEVNIYDAKIEKEAAIRAGVGEVNFKDSIVKNMDVRSGVGSFSFSGKALGKTSIKGGIGEADLKIDGSAKDYDFDVSAGLGEVRINGKKSKTFLADRQKETGAENTITVKGGIGSVSIRFKD